ncbi:hypothetical protein CDL15_Pgr024929 [Punica granatum]|nr:hypothetical protein CDL15_Pgr024929 [Punica granatum]
MKQSQKKRKKKQKSQASKPSSDSNHGAAGKPNPIEEPLGLGSVADAFGSIALEEATRSSESEKAAALLRAYLLENAGDPSATSSSSAITGSDLGMASSSDSCSGWSEGFSEPNGFAYSGNRSRGNNKAKRLVAATGTVSTVLGKDYMKPSPKREVFKPNRFSNRVFVNESEEAEQFLMGMLGDECELSLAVVRDLLCQCGYNVEKALDVLMDVSASSDERSINSTSLTNNANSREDTTFVVSSDENLADRESECTSYSCESEFQDSMWFVGNTCRNYSEALVGSEIHSATCSRAIESNVSQEVLESFYKIYKSPQHEPRTMNWRNIAKKLSSFSNGTDVGHSITEPREYSNNTPVMLYDFPMRES